MNLLPQSIIREIAKNAAQKLDPSTKMSASACLLLNKATVMFIHYLAATANDFTLASGRSTINCTDVMDAMNEIGFHSLAKGTDDFLQRLV